MGRAILGGILKAGKIPASDIMVADVNPSGLEELKNTYGVNTTLDNMQAAQSDLLFLCVKPNVLFSVIKQIKEAVSEQTVLVSIVAGQTIAAIETAFEKPVKLIRVMPNTPALVGEAMAALSLNQTMCLPEYREEVKMVTGIFDLLGKSETVPESLMDAVTAVSGSSPAYIFMLIEAMADAAVIGGMPRKQAYTFAAQAVYGSAKMVLETGKHPGELKDMVCSPAGTTIDAVAVLEQEGFRSSIIKAMTACMEKSKNM